MLNVFIYSIISGFALLLGAFIGIYFKMPQKIIARIMAFGSGVLICAMTFGLMEEAFKHGGFDAVIIGFLTGGIVFVIGDYFLHISGGRKHKRKQLQISSNDSNGKAIALGAILDGIPESIALGIALFNGQGTGLLMMTAITLSNFPEGISSITGLQKEGFTKFKIILLWGSVAVLSIVTSIASYIFLNDINPNTIGILEAFAAGSILAMLASSMMPEAYEEGGYSIALMTILGFLVSFMISRL